MTTIQDVIGDYTPLSNNVVCHLKLIRGALACKIFFTSNLNDRVCRMGLRRIADDLGIDFTTASKNIEWLVENGYIERVKEAHGTQPAHYRCTQQFYDLAQGNDLVLIKSTLSVDHINASVDLINKEEDKEDKKNMGASAENSDDIFGVKESEPVQPKEQKPLAQRIKDKDSSLLMASLGVTAKERATTTEQDLHLAGWNIGNDNIRQAILDFLEATGLPIPAKPERGKWLKHAKEHQEEFTDLKVLYKKAWLEYKPLIAAGQIDITHPGALTVKMRAILQRKSEVVSQPKLTEAQIERYRQLQENHNGTP